MKVLTVSGSILVLALATAACSSGQPLSDSSSPTSMSTPTGEAGPAGFKKYYTQPIAWEKCGDFECATVTAPLSWQDPKAGEIELALKRQKATGKRTGSLLLNPGGPGASGVELFEDGLLPRFGDSVQSAFDIVGFDPRGVGSSTAVECWDDKTKDEHNTLDHADGEAGLAEAEKEATAFAQACKKNTGDLLAHVDTQSAARDLDMLRAALGDEKLSYAGFSYGSQLGATYAGLFPDKAGRLVLDGAVDTTQSSDEVAEGQAVGFEKALRSYVAWCQAEMKSCPLGGSVDDGMAQVKAVLESAHDDPLPTSSDRVVTESLALTGVFSALYTDQDWPFFTMALTEAIDLGAGDSLLAFADEYNDRAEDGSYPNDADAGSAIRCLDARGNSDPAAMKAQAERIEAAAPTLGEYFSHTALRCKNWPYPVVKREFDVHAKGAAPIVVIGTTGDAATPYENAQALAATLDAGVLVTYRGEGHTAYGVSNACIADAVEDYLVNGAVPQDGLTC